MTTKNPWHNPVPFDLVVTYESESFKTMPEHKTGLPISDHPGAFGAVRTNHIHEGVDLYVPEGTVVRAVEDGVVVAVKPFTGAIANLPWWEDTWVVMVEGPTGVVCYGEVIACIDEGATVKAGDIVGCVKRVLKHDKGRPMSMLHLELHAHGSRECPEWHETTGKPDTLLDPTPHLLLVSVNQGL